MSIDAVSRLLGIMARLRGPGGCPWDREQTLESLKSNLVEETYEVVDAIEGGDREQLCEELGDLLLQIVFQSQICSEEGAFDFQDVAGAISEKLVRRHPHIFGDGAAETAEQVTRNWEKIKKAEKGKGHHSVLAGVPRSMPALPRAHQVQRKAARVGFDWDDINDVVAKVHEELDEVKAEIASGDREAVKAELGDLLFSVVNLCRFGACDPEEALKGTVEKFTRRFQYVEEHFHDAGKDLDACSLEEMDAVWREAKSRES
jgi:MazG family protein